VLKFSDAWFIPIEGIEIAERAVYVLSGEYAQGEISFQLDGNHTLIAAYYSFSLATNALATALIAYKTWKVLLQVVPK
jgi:hypothetical protein